MRVSCPPRGPCTGAGIPARPAHPAKAGAMAGPGPEPWAPLRSAARAAADPADTPEASAPPLTPAKAPQAPTPGRDTAAGLSSGNEREVPLASYARGASNAPCVPGITPWNTQI